MFDCVRYHAKCTYNKGDHVLDYLPWLIDMSNLEYWSVGIVVGVSITAIVVTLFWFIFLFSEANYYEYHLGLKVLGGMVVIIFTAFLMLSGIKSYGPASDRYDYQGSHLDASTNTVNSLAITVRQPGESASTLKDKHAPLEVTVTTEGSKSTSTKIYLCQADECFGLTVGQPIGWLIYRPYGESSWYLLPPGAPR